DDERTNERSALVLLALLGLRRRTPWPRAGGPLLRVVDIMEWIGVHYGKVYKPNTRETIRRRTLHQFIKAGLVSLNPDEPRRAINSPQNRYQITPRARDL